MIDATRATVNGTVLVAVGEGIAIGIGYYVAGVPNALIFVIFTTAFAMIPFGAWLAFSVAAVISISGGGSGIAAVGIFLWGTLVMLAGDHFVWPTLVKFLQGFLFSSHSSASSAGSPHSASSACSSGRSSWRRSWRCGANGYSVPRPRREVARNAALRPASGCGMRSE